MRKLAIIGASYLQNPLIEKAKAMGLETHVFAWECGDVGEKTADYFYPISIVEKEQILARCKQIGIDGICTIASDLAAITVNYVAHHLGLTCNNPSCAEKSTNKHEMRKAFEAGNDPSPKSFLIRSIEDLAGISLRYPLIVKPTDRSGSRGITKVETPEGLLQAIDAATSHSFEKAALVEEFAVGQEYSVECISYRGKHQLLAITLKYTTGAPRFIETGHLQPAPLTSEMAKKVQTVVFHALDSLEITNGASHSELKIAEDGTIQLIEIGGRMGGDFIGSDLVALSTGVDFVRAVIDVALGNQPDLTPSGAVGAAAVRFVFSRKDLEVLDAIKKQEPEILVREELSEIEDRDVTDSSSRFGAYILADSSPEKLQKWI